MQQQIVLASRPDGWVTPEHFRSIEVPVPAPGAGQVLLKHRYLSVDPYMRGRMNAGRSYVAPFEIDQAITSGVVAEVLASEVESLPVGTLVTGLLDWSEYSVANADALRVLPAAPVPLSYHLGILGMPGLTAYVGLIEVAKCQPGESVFVNAAAGAVGSVVGQIARELGCHVVGSAGGPDKAAHLVDTLGFSAAFDYRSADDLNATLRGHFPRGIDVLFENVGGAQFEAAIGNMARFGRIALCGMIADYNESATAPPPGPRGMLQLVGRNVMLQGFIVSNYPDAAPRWAALASRWLADGRLTYQETIADGLAAAPDAFVSMLKGGNLGKQIVRVCPD